MFRILTPASASSITGRIRSIGCAFDMYNEITAEEFDGAIVINNHADTMRNRSNLIIKSFYEASEILGYSPKGIRIGVKTAIPMSRGLGSSASCVNSGVMLAFLLSGSPFTRKDIYDISRSLAPENANLAPNLYGGLVLSARDGAVTKINITSDYVFTLIVPDYKVPQARTEAHLLNDLSYEDYCESAALANLFTLGMSSGNDRLIRESFSYANIYTPSDAVKGYDKVYDVCEKAGALGLFICGNGPAMAAISNGEESARKIRMALSRNSVQGLVKSFALSSSGTVYTQTQEEQ